MRKTGRPRKRSNNKTGASGKRTAAWDGETDLLASTILYADTKDPRAAPLQKDNIEQFRKPKRRRQEEGSDRSPPRAVAAAKEGHGEKATQALGFKGTLENAIPAMRTKGTPAKH